jgi:hypothetical protein
MDSPRGSLCHYKFCPREHYVLSGNGEEHMNCILFAVYLPNLNKRYVLEEILSLIKIKEKNAKIFIGIQHSSIPETEEILRKIKGNLKIETQRVTADMSINSDASAFMSALELYSKSDKNFEKCFFIHTKSITTSNDALRHALFETIFDEKWIDKVLENPNVGSFAPCITFTDVQKDIDLMSSCVKFHKFDLKFSAPMEYYYPHTFYIIKSDILNSFLSLMSKNIFTTPIQTYSDRYFFERDFPHIVDMLGFEPSYQFLHGNYSTNYVAPTVDKYNEKLEKWKKENQ